MGSDMVGGVGVIDQRLRIWPRVGMRIVTEPAHEGGHARHLVVGGTH